MARLLKKAARPRTSGGESARIVLDEVHQRDGGSLGQISDPTIFCGPFKEHAPSCSRKPIRGYLLGDALPGLAGVSDANAESNR